MATRLPNAEDCAQRIAISIENLSEKMLLTGYEMFFLSHIV